MCAFGKSIALFSLSQMVQAIQVLRFHLLELEKVLNITISSYNLFVIVKVIVIYYMKLSVTFRGVSL